MRLRKECEHGKYDAHSGMVPCPYVKPGNNYSCSVAHWESCPGGEFLPEGALPSREALAEAFHAMQHDEATGRPAVLVGWDAVVVTQALEWVLDALASQVGESETVRESASDSNGPWL